MSLRTRIISLVAGCLFVVLGTSVVFNNLSTKRMAANQTDEAAKLAVKSNTHAMSAFGEIGDMDGLEAYVTNVDNMSELRAVRAVRAPSVAAEFGIRAGVEPIDEMDRKTLSTGENQKVRDKEAHTLRYVTPVLCVESCLECHETNKVDDVLGVASVTLATERNDAGKGVTASQNITRIMTEITTNIDQTMHLITAVTDATDQQANDINQINLAVGQIDQVSQNNASIFEKTLKTGCFLTLSGTLGKEIFIFPYIITLFSRS